MRYIAAKIRGKTFFLPQECVIHIEHRADVTKVPFSPRGIVGIILFGDEFIPVLDVFLEEVKETKLQILCDFEDCVVAYQADSIGEICDIDKTNTQPITLDNNRYLRSVLVPKIEA